MSESDKPVKDASNGASWDIFHEDGNHILTKQGPQKAYNVNVSQGFEQLHLPLQTSVFFLCSVRVRGIQVHLLNGYQLALTSQATVYLVGRQ